MTKQMTAAEEQQARIDLVRAVLKLAALQNADGPRGDLFIAALDDFEKLAEALNNGATR